MSSKEQPDLFDNAPFPRGVGDLGNRYDLYGGMPPHERVDTSEEAAHRIEPEVNELQRRVLEAIASSGRRGITDEELVDVLSMNPSTLRPRRRELYVKDYIAYARGEDGEPIKRILRSGRPAHVYVVAAGVELTEGTLDTAGGQE